MKSTLNRSRLRRKTIAIRPKPFQRKPPPEPVTVKWPYMSTWEVRVARLLERMGIVFEAQVSFAGGAGILGGMRVDFILPDYQTVIRPMGYWHTLPHRRARDELQRQYLEARGFRVIDLWEEDMANLAEILPQKLGIPVRGGK